LAESIWKEVWASIKEFYPGFDVDVVREFLHRMRPEMVELHEVRKAIVDFVKYLQSI
jgi:hypothetical protein